LAEFSFEMNKNMKEMYKQIYKVIYIANINQLIDETRYVNVLQSLSMNGFKTYHIDNFDKLSLHMQNIGLTDSFNISLLIHLRDMNYKKLSEFALNFRDIGNIFSHKKNKMIDRIRLISNVLKDKLFVIKSFKKIETYDLFKQCNCESFNLCDEVDIIDTSVKLMNKKRIENEWLHYTREDIINRLHLLAQKHYNIDQLKYMNVEIKSINELNVMTHDILELYYKNVTHQIEKSLKSWLTICKMYIDIEVNYVECCQCMMKGYPTILRLKHFSIDIKN
jgi:hypothetical protein